MTDTETRYKNLIGRLRETRPDAGNPDLLTDEIMHAINLHHKKTAPRLLVWIRPLMTAASLFLFGLFFYQQVETDDIVQDTKITIHIKPVPENETNCGSSSTMNLSENRKLLNKYVCYLRSNMAENKNSKQFYQKYLPEYR